MNQIINCSKGTPEQLNIVESLIDKVDIEKTVLIEAYIINASDSFNENFNNMTAIN